jgi:hypothetical protein
MSDDVTRRGVIKLVAAGTVGAGIVSETSGEAAAAQQVDQDKDKEKAKAKGTKGVHGHLAQTERDAVLVSAVASFHTNDDDKDWDTKLWIYVRPRAGADIARVGPITGRFPDHTDNGPFGLSIITSVAKNAIAGAHTDVVIQTVGHDTWRFNYFLNLGFSDGSHLTYSWIGQVLDQDVTSITRIL